MILFFLILENIYYLLIDTISLTLEYAILSLTSFISSKSMSIFPLVLLIGISAMFMIWAIQWKY